MHLVSVGNHVGNYGLELRSSSCDYACIWPALESGHVSVCYEFESCWFKKPEELIRTAEQMQMVITKRVTHARKKR